MEFVALFSGQKSFGGKKLPNSATLFSPPRIMKKEDIMTNQWFTDVVLNWQTRSLLKPNFCVFVNLIGPCKKPQGIEEHRLKLFCCGWYVVKIAREREKESCCVLSRLPTTLPAIQSTALVKLRTFTAVLQWKLDGCHLQKITINHHICLHLSPFSFPSNWVLALVLVSPREEKWGRKMKRTRRIYFWSIWWLVADCNATIRHWSMVALQHYEVKVEC